MVRPAHHPEPSRRTNPKWFDQLTILSQVEGQILNSNFPNKYKLVFNRKDAKYAKIKNKKSALFF
jgi:hypothetical protein